MFPNDAQNENVPCARCHTARSSVLMIPAKTRCPSSEWTLEYKGYLASTAEYETPEAFKKGAYYRGSYICVDENPESLTGKSHPREGPQIYQVNAACGSFSGALTNCPPYQGRIKLTKLCLVLFAQTKFFF